MSQLNPANRLSLVEMAVARSARQAAHDDRHATSENDRSASLAGRRAYDAENAAVGASTRARSIAENVSTPLSASGNPGSEKTPRSPVPRGSRFWLSHLASACVGAALTGYLLIEPASQPATAESTFATRATPVPKAESPQLVAPAAPPDVVARDAVLAIDEGVKDMLEQWRDAWSRRDIDDYLGFYSPDFVPADGSARSTWADSRRQNFLARSDIRVKIRHVTIDPVDNATVKVWLHQDYVSGAYKEARQPKTFLLKREGDDWKIAGEWQGLRLQMPVWHQTL